MQLSLCTCILGGVSGCGDQRMAPRTQAAKVCPQIKETESYEATIMEFKRGKRVRSYEWTLGFSLRLHIRNGIPFVEREDPSSWL